MQQTFGELSIFSQLLTKNVNLHYKWWTFYHIS